MLTIAISRGAILSSASLSFTQLATSDGCFSSGIKSNLFTTTIESFSLKISKISRTLYFSQTCKEVYLKFLIVKKEKFKEENNTNIIFVNNSNMRLTDRSVRRLINKYSEKANLQKEVSPYTLRHSFCIYMLRNGMSKEYLAKLLDLKSIGLLDVYENLCKKEIL